MSTSIRPLPSAELTDAQVNFLKKHFRAMESLTEEVPGAPEFFAAVVDFLDQHGGKDSRAEYEFPVTMTQDDTLVLAASLAEMSRGLGDAEPADFVAALSAGLFDLVDTEEAKRWQNRHLN